MQSLIHSDWRYAGLQIDSQGLLCIWDEKTKYMLVIVISLPARSNPRDSLVPRPRPAFLGTRPHPREGYNYYITCCLGNITVEERYQQRWQHASRNTVELKWSLLGRA